MTRAVVDRPSYGRNVLQKRHLVVRASSTMQHPMFKPSARKRHLQRNCCLIARVLRAMAMSGYVRRIRRYNQAIFASLDPRLVRAIGKSNVNQASHEKYKPLDDMLVSLQGLDGGIY